MLCFNADGPAGLKNRWSPGSEPKLTAEHRKALATWVERGPIPAIYGVVRWRRCDLVQELCGEFGVSVDESTVGWVLRDMGYAKLSARPRHHAQDEYVVDAFKSLPAKLAKIQAHLGPDDTWPRRHLAQTRLGKCVEIELWWQDEARVGQKNKITWRWAKRGTRPLAPKDQRTQWASIFGAICPAKGKGAGLVPPHADTHAMTLLLAEISAHVDPGAHAVILVDQAGWHTTPKLNMPNNITLLELPPRAPELNPVENIWQDMRDNWLSNRVFGNDDDIVVLCCEVWNRLIERPWKIRSIGMREWAHGS